MFITVRHGDNCNDIFNPDCRMVNFLDSIKRCCEISPEKMVDLTDEQGLVIDILSKGDTDRASNYLRHCETYVLVEKVPVMLGTSRGARQHCLTPESEAVFEAEMRQRRSKKVRKITTNFQYQYVPLLVSVLDIYPDYSIHTEVLAPKPGGKRDQLTPRRMSTISNPSRQNGQRHGGGGRRLSRAGSTKAST